VRVGLDSRGDRREAWQPNVMGVKALLTPLWYAQKLMDSWDRKKGESTKAYQAFILYREMGAERSYTRVAQELGKSRTLVQRWGGAWTWVERCADWDAYLLRKADAARLVAIKKANERHVELAQTFLARVRARLDAMSQNALEIEAEHLPKWLDIAVKIERLGLGMSTQLVEHQGKDGGAIKLDLVRQARERLAEKLTPIDEEHAQAVAAPPENTEDAL